MPKKGETSSTASARSKQQRAYNSTDKAKKERAARNKARNQAIKKGKVSKGDGKDIDHKKPLRNGGSKEESNTRVRSKTANRADNGSYAGMKRKGKRK
ncbi:MAG TPA: HNH endonuclease [Bacteroidetes bacterium]|mgnify:FL=1|jgi:hypothetical protein|nr:HNH endonuclease [Bacteroidota bacterium]|tara:strand:- start:85 stop:378 length:294 start_codon:yes stop_codon:yes gene_type:complete